MTRIQVRRQSPKDVTKMDPFHTPLRDLLRLRRTAGDVGFEVEVEYPATHLGQTIGRFLDASMHQEHLSWNVSEDGSLRSGIEMVSRKPVRITHVRQHLENLRAIVRTADVAPVWSIRTSTHIHVNAQSKTFTEIFRACVFFWLIEDYLVQSQGKARTGNLFCLRNSDARSLALNFLQDFRRLEDYSQDNFRRIASLNANARYSSLNLAALGKFGSLEFRFLRGMYNTEELEFWANLLYNLVENAGSVDPKTVLRDPVEEWLPRVLGKEQFEVYYTRFPDTARVTKAIFSLAPLLAGRIDSEHWEKEQTGQGYFLSVHEDIDYRPTPHTDDDFEPDTDVPDGVEEPLRGIVRFSAADLGQLRETLNAAPPPDIFWNNAPGTHRGDDF